MLLSSPEQKLSGARRHTHLHWRSGFQDLSSTILLGSFKFESVAGIHF